MRFKRIRRLLRDLGTSVFGGRRYSRDGLTNVGRLRFDIGLRTRRSVLRIRRNRYIVSSRRRFGRGSRRRRVLDLRRQGRYLSCRRGRSGNGRRRGGR
jgi:hypothetical protein